MGGKGQGNGINSVGVHSSAEREGSALTVLGIRVCAGYCTILVVIRVMHEVTM